MTENMAGRGEGLAGLVAQRIKECRDTAKRWKTESRIVRINRAIGKDYADQLDALASLLETALEAAAPAGTAPTAEYLARLFHATYERLAPQYGYVTRKESAVEWEQVPENNRKLMTAVCEAILLTEKFNSEAAALATPSPQTPVDILAELDHEKYTGPMGKLMQARPAATQEPAGSGAKLPSITTDWRWMRLRGYLRQWLTPHEFEIAMDCLDKAEGPPRCSEMNGSGAWQCELEVGHSGLHYYRTPEWAR